jgi:hypothetical protein
VHASKVHRHLTDASLMPVLKELLSQWYHDVPENSLPCTVVDGSGSDIATGSSGGRVLGLQYPLLAKGAP